MPTTSSVKRACDACHRRKVRCDGRHPCDNCNHASLTCTFNSIPQKKGPKGSRAKVISELRRAQRQTPRSYNGPSDMALLNHAHMSQSYGRTPGLLSPQIIDSCLDFFFKNMHPTMPILDRGRLQQQLPMLDQSPELYCLLTSLCAFMMIQPGMKSFGDESATSAMAHGTILLDEALRVRKGFDYIEDATQHSVITSFFFFGSYFGLNKHTTAWYHLREATTLAQMLGMQEENGYLVGDPVDLVLKRRLFWLLFVTERAYALQRHHPLTLHSTIALPTIEENSPEALELSGFLHLVNIFKPFDDTFVGLWNRSRSDCSTAWLSQLQDQISNALPLYLDSTESQAADLRTSQQWLRTMVWKLCFRNDFLSSTSGDPAMTFKYPLQIARDLVGVTSQLSRSSMEVHGIGLIEKIYDIASTLTEVMSCLPIETSTFEFGPRDYLSQCLTLISTLRDGDSRFLPLLLDRIDTNLPAMSTPILQPLIPWDVTATATNGATEGRVEELFDSGSSNASTTSMLGSPEVLLMDSLDGLDGLEGLDYPPVPTPPSSSVSSGGRPPQASSQSPQLGIHHGQHAMSHQQQAHLHPQHHPQQQQQQPQLAQQQHQQRQQQQQQHQLQQPLPVPQMKFDERQAYLSAAEKLQDTQIYWDAFAQDGTNILTSNDVMRPPSLA